MRFVDEVRVSVASGTGGNGIVHFLREKYRANGGPDGGSGGKGGAIIFEATRQRNTLVDFRWNKVYRADDGEAGGLRCMTGGHGGDLTLLVPVGTQISDHETGIPVADLDYEGAQFEIPGGDGGRGNATFKTSTNRTPRQAYDGYPGNQFTFVLELKLIADVGLLGFPNAGKSTLISRVSAAKPRVADYPFTTLVPNLGVVRLGTGESFVIADIPGLIEGAADGAGLGLRFLKHVERCGLYLHLLSLDPNEIHTPLERFNMLNLELKKYDDAVAKRPQLVVLTKTDLLEQDAVDQVRSELQSHLATSIHAISSVRGDGLQQLMGGAWDLLKRTRPTVPEQ
ncbi:MAG: GTP-binding protein [Kiritimatiellia bacterium]|jgi:GTP-binding protein